MRFWVGFVLVLTGCSEELAEPGRVVLVQGEDTDAWNTAQTAEIEKILEDESRIALETRAAPVDRFSLGRGSAGRYEVTGRDPAGAVTTRASSVPIDPAGFAEDVIPLFVSQAARFSRAPEGFSVAQTERPPLALLGGWYLLAAGGDEIAMDTYDLGYWRPVALPAVSCPAPPCTFRTIAVQADLVFAIGDDWAIWLNFFEDTSGDVEKPKGLPSWADVAGGSAVSAPDGSIYVVGATRADPPTQWVVEVDPEGALAARALTTARSGASAVWVDGRGLAVVGGSADGPGVELLLEGTEAFQTLPYPSDASVGAALVVLDSATLLRAGGRDPALGTSAPTVELPLGCTTCAPKARSELVELDRAQGFSLGEGELLFVGDDAAGATAAIHLTSEGLSPAPFREPKVGASAIALPTGHVAVVGPGTSLELFIR